MGLDPLSLALIGGGASALFKGIGQHKQNKAATTEQQRTQGIIDKFLADYKGYQGNLQEQLGGSQALFGPRTTTSEGSSVTNQTSDTTPTITPQFSPLLDMIRKTYEGRIKSGFQLPPGYEETQINNAVAAFKPQEDALANEAARRGVPASTYTLASPVANARAAQIANVRAQTPLLKRQLETEDLTGGSQLAATFGKGEHATSTSRTNTSGSQTSPADIGSILAYYSMLAPHDPIIVGAPAKPNPWLAGAGAGIDIGSLLYSLNGRKPAATSGGVTGGVPDWVTDPAYQDYWTRRGGAPA